MTGVFIGKAWSHAKPVDPSQGLEAWRQVRKNITLQGPQHVQKEFGYLLRPSPIAEKQELHLWIKAWEDRASKLEMSSKPRAFNDELRRQVFMESLPKDVKEMVEMEKNKGQLASHAELRQWLINLGTNSSLSTSVTPSQLAINQVSETPQSAAQYFAQPHKDEIEYSPDDRMCYICTSEEAHFAQANPMLPEIGQALLALNQQEKGGIYGGGKAKRKSAGKIDTGKFQGKCWN